MTDAQPEALSRSPRHGGTDGKRPPVQQPLSTTHSRQPPLMGMCDCSTYATAAGLKSSASPLADEKPRVAVPSGCGASPCPENQSTCGRTRRSASCRSEKEPPGVGGGDASSKPASISPPISRV